MNEQSAANKRAWEYRAYEYWNGRRPPREEAAAIRRNPAGHLRYHRRAFADCAGKRVANVCGSCGRRAVAQALLGAQATVFDISEENRRYGLELAAAAEVSVRYAMGDFLETAADWPEAFDIAYMEGGVLHYFADIYAFAERLHAILRPGGRLILSDFHPFRKIAPAGPALSVSAQTGGDYFDTGLHTGDVAYRQYMPHTEGEDFPPCLMRYHALGEVVDAVCRSGFRLTGMEEHPHWEDSRLPGEFTLYAVKEAQHV